MNSLPQYPLWFYQTILLILVFIAGQVLSEWIKIKMRQVHGSKDRRAGNSLLIDEKTVDKIVDGLMAHAQTIKGMADETKANGVVLVDIKKAVEEHTRIEAEPIRQIHAVYRKLVEGS